MPLHFFFRMGEMFRDADGWWRCEKMGSEGEENNEFLRGIINFVCLIFRMFKGMLIEDLSYPNFLNILVRLELLKL